MGSVLRHTTHTIRHKSTGVTSLPVCPVPFVPWTLIPRAAFGATLESLFLSLKQHLRNGNFNFFHGNHLLSPEDYILRRVVQLNAQATHTVLKKIQSPQKFSGLLYRPHCHLHLTDP